MFKRILCGFTVAAGMASAQAQVALPASAIPASAVNTNDLGFLVRTVAIDWSGAGSSAWMNSVADMELALGPVTTNTGPGGRPSAGSAVDPTTGYYATNCANFSGGENPNITSMLSQQGTTGNLVQADSNGFWVLDAKNFVSPSINCDANGPPTVANGVFNSPSYPHNYFPGVPTCAAAGKGNDYESVACSFMGHTHLPAGTTTLNVNSDDGFLLWLSPLANPYDARGLVQAGEFDGGRSSATTTMQVTAPEAGWYTVRLDFEQGTGGILCEFFSTDQNGNNVLVNDTTTKTALLAYPIPDTFPNSYPIQISPANGSQYAPDAPPPVVSVAIQDGTSDHVTKILAARLNGAALTLASVSNTPSFTPNGQPLGNLTWVTAKTPPGLVLPAGQTVPIEVDYANAEGAAPNLTWSITTSGTSGPPTLTSAYNVGQSSVTVTFSEAVNPVTAANISNYSISRNISVLSVATNGAQTVLLTVSPLTLGTNYTLTVSGVQDLASPPNTIKPGSQITFVASEFALGTVGTPSPAGSTTLLSGGLDATGGGSIGGSAEAFQFNYLTMTGDFDVSVRLQGLGLSSPFAKAALMARASLSPGSAFAAAVATPSIGNCFFDSRASQGASETVSGSFPVNYPNNWLRLKRAGSIFTGYASFDGSNWVQLGSAGFTATPVYLGLAVASQTATATTVAQFRDFGNVAGGTIGTFALPHEPLGPSSRRTQFVFSEIMYTPPDRTDGLNTEYLEIYNSNPWWDDISGFQLAGEVQFTFPSNTIVPGGGFLVVAAAPADMRTVYGITNVTGPYSSSLKKGGELQLLNAQGGIVLDVSYTNTLPWPAGAHKTGHSIVLARPTYGEADPRAWDLSDVAGGSPGGPEAYRPSPLRNVVVNELLANPSDGQTGFVELYNHSATPVDLSGCVLTDDATKNKFIFPANSVIGAAGYLSLPQGRLGFSLNPAGGLVLFRNPDGSRVLDAVSYEPQGRGVSLGRWPDGADDFYPLSAASPGAANGGILLGDIVINEMMYKPISGNDDDQYLELYNNGTNTADLSGWQFVAGIDYTFPAGITLAPGAYLVVAKNEANLFAKYPNLNAANTVGNYSGKLPHKGGRVALARPDFYVTTNGALITTNTILAVEDEVTFKSGGRWGQWAHGGGSSLELINPNTDHRLAYNWADSDETGKSSWTNLTFTGLMDNGANFEGGKVDVVQVGILDVGEALVDNLVFQAGTTGANLIKNPGFESGLQGWEVEGDHVTSGLETASGLGGDQSAQSLHLRATDGVWTGFNSVESTLVANTLASGSTATLKMSGRWLRGSPEVLMRVRGNWIELTGALPVPSNLGTPGQANSRAVSTAPPAIYEVKHSPALPAGNQAVVVTARFHDLNGFQPTLLYRVDTAVNTSPIYTRVAMNDSGTGGDALGGDGIYSATIPARAAGTVVAFLVEGADSATGVASVFPQVLNDNSGLPRECVVVFGDPSPGGPFGQYHLWLTQNWINHWNNQAGLGNGQSDATLVDSGGRIIYNAGGHYAGSPYHQYTGSPVTTLGGMNMSVPDDDLMLGASSLNKQHVPGNGPLDDNTIQREQTSFWMARQMGMRWDYRRYYILYVNGNRHGPLMEDSQTPDGDMVNEYFPNDNNGFLYKNHSWFEFQPMPPAGQSLSFDNDSWCTLNKYTTTINGAIGQEKLARYRWNYWIRQYPDSANNFTNVYALVTAANIVSSSPLYYSSMEALVDTETWMRWSALEHATGDWDSYVTQNQWNMFCYKPVNGKLTLLKWDWNITLGSSGSWGPDGSNLYTIGGGDSPMNTFQGYPPYQRAMLRGFLELANGPMNNVNVNPVLDAKYAAFSAIGLNVSYGVLEPGAAGLKSWIATMHSSLLSAIANAGMANVPFAVSGATNYSTGFLTTTITGTAPLPVKNIAINGQTYPVTWSSLKQWNVTVPLSAAANLLLVQGVDLNGNPVAGATVALSVTDTNPAILIATNAVRINEWMAGNKITILDPADGNSEDWFELYNPNAVAADLSGYYLTHDLTNPTAFPIPSGTLVPANGFLLVWADSGLTSANDGTNHYLHATFKLSKSGASIGLFDPGVRAVDTVTFGAQTSDISEGRYPDGGTNIYFMTQATPGRPNKFSNTAPVLSSIPDQTVKAGSLLTFAASATDVDSPPQTLTFSLEPGSPSGAAIDPVTGVFDWSVPPGSATSTNSITVQVTDDGTPPLNATQTFAVIVTTDTSFLMILPPQVGLGQVVLNWTTVAGLSYRVEFKNDLTATNWTAISGDVFASGTTASITDTFSPTNASRFYRVVVVP